MSAGDIVVQGSSSFTSYSCSTTRKSFYLETLLLPHQQYPHRQSWSFACCKKFFLVGSTSSSQPSFFLTASSSRPNLFLTAKPLPHNSSACTWLVSVDSWHSWCVICINVLLQKVLLNFQTCSPSLWLLGTMPARRPFMSTLNPCHRSASCWREWEDTWRRNMMSNFQRFPPSSMHAKILQLPTMTFRPSQQLPSLLELHSSKRPPLPLCIPSPVQGRPLLCVPSPAQGRSLSPLLRCHSPPVQLPPLPPSNRCSPRSLTWRRWRVCSVEKNWQKQILRATSRSTPISPPGSSVTSSPAFTPPPGEMTSSATGNWTTSAGKFDVLRQFHEILGKAGFSAI